MAKTMRVFISYSYEDREKVRQLYAKLKEEGFDPWMDTAKVYPGQDWDHEIRNAIRSSDVVVICLSNNSIQKQGYAQKELRQVINIANEKTDDSIFIIPVKLDNSPVPSFLKPWQYVDLSSPNGIDRLLKALEIKSDILSLDERQIQDVIRPDKKPRKQVSVAMPFKPEMEDTYHYGIERAVDTAGFSCYRSDKVAFVGDILEELKHELEKSAAVIADLTESNPNVYLEAGFAWGKNKPTILVIKQGHKLHFDVQGQKCLHYSSIRHLEEILTKELQELQKKGIIP